MALSSRSEGSRVTCSEEVLFVELQRAADLLARGPMHLLREHDLSGNQYNVLRILRGSPQGLLCGEIGDRMVTREPDITRLLDRLEKRGLIERCRQAVDRRRVLTRITQEGLNLLAGLDEPMCNLHRRQLGHLGPGQQRQLARLIAGCCRELA